MQRELESAKQAADQAKAQVNGAREDRAASLNSELEKTNGLGNPGDLAGSYIKVGEC